MKGSLGFAESREGEETGGAPEGPRRRNWASQKREAAARADGGRTPFVLVDGPRAVKAAAGLVSQLPSGLPPLPHLDAALPFDECLCHGKRDNLDETDRGSEHNRTEHYMTK